MEFHQSPPPGSRQVAIAGEVVHIALRVDGAPKGCHGFLRTNWGSVGIRRKELIAQVEEGRSPLAQGWHDLPMEAIGEGVWEITLPLAEAGLFSLKCTLLDATGKRHWPEGEDAVVKVTPALLSGNNTIYNAFIRQFGPNRAGGYFNQDTLGAEKFLGERGYALVPPSGHFADVQAELEHIQGKLGFRFVMFLPVQPTPVTFAKMGCYGSPFAPTDFFTVDSAMAVFDRKTTPLEQFEALCAEIHRRGGRVLMDIPLDHTGWASTLQVHHPEWFIRNADGTFQSPGAWGTIWEDLCKLDAESRGLWKYLGEVLCHWCHCGVDGFRCDAGYMLPIEMWQYLTAKVRDSYPETVFLLEGLGGAWEKTAALMMEGGMDWAYSESFQQYDYAQEKGYLEHTLRAYANQGNLVQFAETHDNPRLAARSEAWALHRIAYSALTAPAGCFAITNGVEWFATEKIDVHGAASLRWGGVPNAVEQIRTINALLREHPAFYGNAELTPLRTIQGGALSLLRRTSDACVLVLWNPEMERDVEFSWSLEEFRLGDDARELLTGNRPYPLEVRDGRAFGRLSAGEVCCLSPVPFVPGEEGELLLRNCVKEALYFVLQEVGALEPRELSSAEFARFQEQPVAFLHEFCGVGLDVTEWREEDARRVVMLPPGGLLYVHLKHPFRGELRDATRCVRGFSSLPQKDGTHFVLLFNQFGEGQGGHLNIHRQDACAPNACAPLNGELLSLPEAKDARVSLCILQKELTDHHTGLCANRRASYTLSHGVWGLLRSKYEGLLVANPVQSYPSERRALLLRFRAWLRRRDFSTELAFGCQESFRVSLDDNALEWRFAVPCGFGEQVQLRLVWQLSKEENCGRLLVFCEGKVDSDELMLILRPDVDNRSHHAVTKAYQGAEQAFPGLVHPEKGGFAFGELHLRCGNGEFSVMPEWQYQMPLPVERERGLDDSMDVFSPGYFSVSLGYGDPAVVDVWCGEEGMEGMEGITNQDTMGLEDALRAGLRHFLVRRDDETTVIAGYPWFLDWGRDTLICLPGLIRAGLREEARRILCQFAKFEERGTLPNMIRGNDTSDRATSDAPLWLFVAVKAYIDEVGNEILTQKCGNRTLATVLEDLAESVWGGCPNGVAVDAATGLVFSPPHYTWMDTNYPAATPRCGFPVEIQCLWIAALRFLAELTGAEKWRKREHLALRSFLELYPRQDGKGLVDCLHAIDLCDAHTAVADDAIRPNQLFAVTLGITTERALNERILAACAPLLTPAGIRSLADAPVLHPLAVWSDGVCRNDPNHPYWGHYSGQEDLSRKPAYHNGTAWMWQMPLYCEAAFRVYGEPVREACLSRLASAAGRMSCHCVRMLSEIADGDAPHTPKGCVAQAWSMTEFLRVWLMLKTSDTKSVTE